jgi:dihydroflavonol-4-reductase
MGQIEPHGRVLVTGATGFIGGAVTRALIEAGHEVVALVRSRSRADRLPGGARPVIGDMTRPETYRPLVAEAGAVVHTAQVRIFGRITGRRLARLAAANETMTATLAAACADSGRRLLYTSGSFGFGDHGTAWITEETPLDPSPLGADHAGQVRRLRAMRAAGLDAVILHLGFVYGAGGRFKSAFYQQARRGMLRRIGAGANYWSPVHIDDVAAAYITALEHAPAGAEYHVVDDSPMPMRAIVNHVARALGRPPTGQISPRLAGLIAGRPAVESLTTSYRVSNARIRGELGWAPAHPSFAAGLPTVIRQLQRDVSEQQVRTIQ